MRTSSMWREADRSRPRPADPRAGAGAGDRAAAAAQAKPHVCFVAPHAWPVMSRDPDLPVMGGAEVQQAILARLFAARGYPVSMICLDFGQAAEVQIDGVRCVRAFRMRDGVPGLRFFHPRLSTMWRRLREVNADIYYYRSTAMWVGVLSEFCRRHDKRLIYAGASDRDFVPGQGGQLRNARDRWLYEHGVVSANAIVAQNAFQVESCRQTYGRDAVYIPSCYVPPDSAAREGRGDAVLWVSMFEPNKRPERFLELARRLPHRRCIMVGGPRKGHEAFYEKMRAEAAAIANLEFRGFLPLEQAERCFDEARVLVNTSLYEGMPNAFLQAWARGVPTVATVDVGVAAHRVAQDVTALAAEVEALLASALRWRAASAACSAHFERTHAPAEVFARYAKLFEEIAA